MKPSVSDTRSSAGAAIRGALALPLAALLTACSERPWSDPAVYPYSTTDAATDFQDKILAVYGPITWILVVVFVVVFAIMAYTLIRFRDDGSPGNPEQVHGNTQLEIGWTLLPVVIVIGITVPTVRTVFELGDAAPDGALEVRVIGKRWWWAFEYVESGVKTANELHLPAGVPVSLLIQSDTVIHSFWTPRLGGKRDAVPGRVNRMWFTIKDAVAKGSPVTYRGACAEYCGEAHALMRYRVVAHEKSEFETWLATMNDAVDLSADPKAQAGEKVFSSAGCIGCHAVAGNDAAKGVIGPDLTRFGERQMLGADTVANDAANLAQWIRDPNSIKPGTTATANPSRGAPYANDGMNIPLDRSGGPDGPDGILSAEELSDADLDALVAYLLAQKSTR